MKKIEHIGIAVKNLEQANELYTRILGIAPYKEEKVDHEHVITSFFKTGDHKIELLEATNERSAIHRFIERRGEGIHHIAFEVDDIVAEMKRLKEAGCILLSEEPKRGADHKWVCFIHPSSTNGVLIELCQSISDHPDE